MLPLWSTSFKVSQLNADMSLVSLVKTSFVAVALFLFIYQCHHHCLNVTFFEFVPNVPTRILLRDQKHIVSNIVVALIYLDAIFVVGFILIANILVANNLVANILDANILLVANQLFALFLHLHFTTLLELHCQNF